MNLAILLIWLYCIHIPPHRIYTAKRQIRMSGEVLAVRQWFMKTYTENEIELALSEAPDAEVTADIIELRRRMAIAVCRNLFDMTVEAVQQATE